MAMPPDREALRMARLACLDNFAGSVESHQYLGIEQNHRFVTCHSTGIGDSISPTILTLPAMNPKMDGNAARNLRMFQSMGD
jgi:hypothetical protein